MSSSLVRGSGVRGQTRYLVTGGAGFIGSHLADLLVSRGDEVYVIDDLSTGSIQNIQHLIGTPGFHFVHGTILNQESMVELVGTCDIVVHLAAAVGVKYIIDNPLTSLETNVRGTEVVLSLAAKFRKKVFIASTSEVYGKQTHSPLCETDYCVMGNTTVSRWSYACTKALDEFWALAYYRSKGLPVIIGRFFNTVGPRQTGRYGMAIPRFVESALAGRPITVFGDGTQTRTFTNVRDVVRVLAKLLEIDEAVGQVINIGGVGEISIKDLALRVKELAGSSSTLEFVPYEKAYEEGFEDMPRRVPDISKLGKLMGYKPQFTLDQTLLEVIEYFKSRPVVRPAERTEQSVPEMTA